MAHNVSGPHHVGRARHQRFTGTTGRRHRGGGSAGLFDAAYDPDCGHPRTDREDEGQEPDNDPATTQDRRRRTGTRPGSAGCAIGRRAKVTGPLDRSGGRCVVRSGDDGSHVGILLRGYDNERQDRVRMPRPRPRTSVAVAESTSGGPALRTAAGPTRDTATNRSRQRQVGAGRRWSATASGQRARTGVRRTTVPARRQRSTNSCSSSTPCCSNNCLPTRHQPCSVPNTRSSCACGGRDEIGPHPLSALEANASSRFAAPETDL